LAAAAVNSKTRQDGVAATGGLKQALTVEQLAQMPTADVFRLVTKNCAGCHKAFRSKKN